MTDDSTPRGVSATIRLEGPQAGVQAMLVQMAQVHAVQGIVLALPAPVPNVARDVLESADPEPPAEPPERMRFQAGPVCAYVTRHAGQPAQVEFRVFDTDRCTLDLVREELPALLAILCDPGFQAAAGHSIAQALGRPAPHALITLEGPAADVADLIRSLHERGGVHLHADADLLGPLDWEAHPALGRLRPLERAIMRLDLAHEPRRRIAAQLKLTVGTVTVYRRSIPAQLRAAPLDQYPPQVREWLRRFPGQAAAASDPLL